MSAPASLVLFHPNPNAVLLRVYRVDVAEAGADRWDDHATGPAPGDTTPREAVSWSGRAACNVRRYQRLQNSQDAGSAFIPFVDVSVSATVPITTEDTIEVLVNGESEPQQWKVASISDDKSALAGFPLALNLIRSREV